MRPVRRMYIFGAVQMQQRTSAKPQQINKNVISRFLDRWCVDQFFSVQSFLSSLLLAHHVYTLSNTLLTFVVIPVGCIYNTNCIQKKTEKERKKERRKKIEIPDSGICVRSERSDSCEGLRVLLATL